jgi:hypothetical protein
MHAPFSDETIVMCKLAMANINMHAPENGYHDHHITQEKIQKANGMRIGESSDISIKSQKPAQLRRTSLLFALWRRSASIIKQQIQSIKAQHPKHTIQ